MKEEILSNSNNPGQLEKLYRADKATFKQVFNALLPDLKDNTLAGYWDARLNFNREESARVSANDLVFVIIGCILAGTIAKLPAIVPVSEDFFYPRNIGLILFPVLTAFFAWKHKLATGKIIFIAVATLLASVFINALPDVNKSDTLILSCIHILLFLWCVLGYAFVGDSQNNGEKRLGFLKYNGDLLVITTLIVIAGAIMSGLTIGLFSLLGFTIEKFYFENIVVFGLPAAPIIGTYLIQTNQQLVGKVSPVIARIFSPLVLVMLVIYLVAMAYSGKNPYNDREFLLIFNGLLLGVMAIIFFSVSETTNPAKSKPEIWVLFLLSAVTVIVNGIALSAILWRIADWGLTPNRAAVLGGNILILLNLLLVTVQLFKVLSGKAHLARVGKVISAYLPVYFVWAIIVSFLFPFLFGFK